MTLEVLRADRIEPQRWRNGGGFTRELFAQPAGPGWACRISLAEVSQDGAFSAYPGITRWFSVVQGDGVLLHFPDGRRLALDPHSPPLHFDGALAPDCRLQGGATQDLNLMLRADHAEGRMLAAPADEEWLDAHPWRAVFSAVPLRLQIDDADAARLPAQALLVSGHAAHQRWRVLPDETSGGPVAWWMAWRLKDAA